MDDVDKIASMMDSDDSEDEFSDDESVELAISRHIYHPQELVKDLDHTEMVDRIIEKMDEWQNNTGQEVSAMVEKILLTTAFIQGLENKSGITNDVELLAWARKNKITLPYDVVDHLTHHERAELRR